MFIKCYSLLGPFLVKGTPPPPLFPLLRKNNFCFYMRSADHAFSEKYHTLCNLHILHFQTDHKHIGMIHISYTTYIIKSLHVTETSL